MSTAFDTRLQLAEVCFPDCSGSLLSLDNLSLDNPFLSHTAARAFCSDVGKISNYCDNITQEKLKEAAFRNSAKFHISYEVISDGVVRFLRSKTQISVDLYHMVIQVPGLGYLGTCSIEKNSGAPVDFQPSTSVDPSLIPAILSYSKSAIVQDLLKLLKKHIAPGILSESTKEVIEIYEDEAVLADRNGNAIVLAINNRDLTEGLLILGFRSNIQAMQSRGLETCRLLNGHAPKFGFALHSTRPDTFRLLADGVGCFLQCIANKPDSVDLFLTANNTLAFEFGDVNDWDRFRDEVTKVASAHLGPEYRYREVNGGGSCMHNGMQKIVPQCMKLL